jgi:ABC-type glycerol-3-phosphate transport system substrate-binding protein
MPSKRVSRRSFLKGALALPVGMAALEAAGSTIGLRATAHAAVPSKAPVTLVVETYLWEVAGFKDWMDWINQQLTAKFPHITVEKRSAPSTQYWDKIIVKAQSGTLGDVFQLSGPILDQFLAMGGVEPVNKFIDVPAAQKLMPLPLWRLISRQDQLMGVPTLTTTNQIMIYNTKHFEAAGISMPGAGKQEQWLADTVKLTKAPDRYGVVVHTIATGQFMEDLRKFIIAWNTQFSLPDGKPTCNAKEVVEAIAFYRKIVKSGATPMGTEKTIYRPMVWDGKISQLLDGSWVFGMAKSSSGKALSDLSAAPLPFPSQRGNLTFNMYCMYAKSKVKESAAEWLKIAWSEEGAVKFAEFTGSPHAHKVALPQNLVQKMPWLPAYQKVLATDPVADPNPGFSIVRSEADDILIRWAARAVITGEISAQDACEGMQKEMERLSKKYDGKTF